MNTMLKLSPTAQAACTRIAQRNGDDVGEAVKFAETPGMMEAAIHRAELQLRLMRAQEAGGLTADDAAFVRPLIVDLANDLLDTIRGEIDHREKYVAGDDGWGHSDDVDENTLGYDVEIRHYVQELQEAHAFLSETAEHTARAAREAVTA